MAYAQSRICPKERDTKNSLQFSDTSRSSYPVQKTRPPKKEIYRSDGPEPKNERERKDKEIIEPFQRTKKNYRNKQK